MPGSATTPGRAEARDSALDRVAFRVDERVGTQRIQFSRLNGWPVRAPADASPTSSRMLVVFIDMEVTVFAAGVSDRPIAGALGDLRDPFLGDG